MSAFTLRMNDGFKKKLEERAKLQQKSLNQVVNELLAFGTLIEDLTDEKSKIIIREAKGYEPQQEVIVPHPNQIYV